MFTLSHFFQYLGQGVIIILVVLFLLFIIVLLLGRYLVKKDILIFPSLIIFIIDVFYSPLKSVAKKLGFDDTLVDQIGVTVRNRVNKRKFDSIPPEEKIIVLPHCLRSAECNAPLKENGVNCTYCNKCAIGIIKEKAEPMGYKVFIVPGSSFIKKVIAKTKFKSVIGVACYEDLNLTMMAFSDFCPQGVLLSRSGCFETKLDLKTFFEVIGYKKEDNLE
ncbi:MAG: DUF116 domain-containing protein [archaeon]|nr:DUF116 domain-containing protein [archaeon]